MKTNTTSVDKTYKLKSDATPISFTLPSRNTSRYPLLYFDEEKNINRPLRYARNQKSPFEDEQDGNFLLEPIIFDDGFLTVPRTNPVLQQFLHYHPLNGNSFVEVNKTVDAAKEIGPPRLERAIGCRGGALAQLSPSHALAQSIANTGPPKWFASH